MKPVRRSARAESDLLEIWHHIAADDPVGAAKLLRRIDEISQRLASFPEMGAKRDDVAPGLRLFPIGSYLVLYRETGSNIEVVRVLHGARQWQDLF